MGGRTPLCTAQLLAQQSFLHSIASSINLTTAGYQPSPDRSPQGALRDPLASQQSNSPSNVDPLTLSLADRNRIFQFPTPAESDARALDLLEFRPVGDEERKVLGYLSESSPEESDAGGLDSEEDGPSSRDEGSSGERFVSGEMTTVMARL